MKKIKCFSQSLPKSLLSTIACLLLLSTSCSDNGIQGKWKCYDFLIEDTTGIPAVLIEEAVSSAQNTLLIFNADSSYQQDYIVEESELISEIGRYTIKEDHIFLNPEKIGVKELSDNAEIEYKSIANSDFLSDIARAKDYQFEWKEDQLTLKEFIYRGQSRNKTNKTSLLFERTK